MDWILGAEYGCAINVRKHLNAIITPFQRRQRLSVRWLRGVRLAADEKKDRTCFCVLVSGDNDGSWGENSRALDLVIEIFRG